MKTFFRQSWTFRVIPALVICIAALLSLEGIAAAGDRNVTSSGLVAADSAIVTGKGHLEAVIGVTDGTNDATCVLYDNASAATGTVLWKGKVTAANNFGGATFPTPINFTNGIYLDITGTNAACIVYYSN